MGKYINLLHNNVLESVKAMLRGCEIFMEYIVFWHCSNIPSNMTAPIRYGIYVRRCGFETFWN